MKLSENLKRIRKENNLSQEQLAEKLGVSRQAVSKWESGQSYPEMDKVLLICKLFNYNIDELMNENVKEVEETKQSKNNINKYVEDFFAFITKTVEMFSSMKFRQKLKCLTEQIAVAFFLFLIFAIIGSISVSVVRGILGKSVYYVIKDILKSIYIVVALVAGTMILLHIFKIRYLDYYEIVKEDDENEKGQDNKEEKVEEGNEQVDKQESYDEKRKIFIEKKKEKIIIRDPNHSQSKFLTGLFRIVLAFIKFIAICISIGFICTFVALFCLLVLSFLFVKTGLVFVGALLGIISAIIINFIILELFYNFIVSKKSKKTRMAISFVIALVLAGISIGTILIGATKFNYVADSSANTEIEEVYEFEMTDNLSIDHWNSYIEYIEEDRDTIKIVVKHSKYLNAFYSTDENDTIEIYCIQDEAEVMGMIRDIIKDVNNKEIKNYHSPIIYVYASRENIEKMMQNRVTKYHSSMERQINELSNYVEGLRDELEETNNTISDLESELEDKENQIFELRIELKEKENMIESLEEQAIQNE